ncbi:DUF6795 domain-containing protein [Shewanella waksmanii]|uniref:DUF6795 domain-containing protein n=1 Tax=Shewanella waksmanii TaxID=213783 RepID=UPI003735E31B
MALKDIFRKLSNHIGTHKVHLCPQVKGRLVNNGQPLANIRIARGLYYSDGKYTEDECYTDSDGNFTMPEMSLRSSQPALLIAEQFTSQRIFAHHNNNQYLLWASRNSGIKPIKEFAIKLQSLHGDIKDDEVYFGFNNKEHTSPFKSLSICRWEDDFYIIDPEAEFSKMAKGALEE